MKIPLSLVRDTVTPTQEYEKHVEQDVSGWREGDWEAKARLVHRSTPLIFFLAKKRGGANADLINLYVEAGKEGLTRAVRRFKASHRVKFHVFALSHIEKAMDNAMKELAVSRRRRR